jgi:hypothetical protein
MELNAMAMLQALQEIDQAFCKFLALLQVGDLAGREFTPARRDWGVFAEAVEEESDFGEGEVHLGREADQQDSIEGIAGIAALAGDAFRER